MITSTVMGSIMSSNGGEERRTPVSLAAGVNQESALPDTEALCSFCKRIKFGSAGFYRSVGKNFGHRPIRDILKDRKNCIFCREIAEFYDEWSRKTFHNQVPDLEHEDGARGLPFAQFVLHPESSFKRDQALNKLLIGDVRTSVNRIRVVFNVLKPFPDSGTLCPVLQFQKCSQSPLQVSNDVSLCDWESGKEQAYSGRIRPLVADTRLFLKWKETCCATHGDHCNSIFAGTRPTWLRLIDVEKRCVVDSKHYSSYVALSYVWGEYELKHRGKVMPKLTKDTGDDFCKPQSLTREIVLSTIDDAIEVAQGLGEKYIWVDCLCIMQDNEDDKGVFLPQMDSIYGFASVTIIAASGIHADAGLCGMRSGSRSRQQKPFTIKGVSLVRTLDPEGGSQGKKRRQYVYLEDSKWLTRGWTFQEKIFSRRALLFTEEQVYWECERATWCEDGLWETRQPVIYRPCFINDCRRPWISSHMGAFETIYRKLVEEYSRRTLTYGSDGLDAFRGILNALERETDQDFLWALPTSLLSRMLTWRCNERSIKRREEMCTVRSSDGTVARCPFPSWSWVGWVGEVKSFITETPSTDLIFYYLDGKRSLCRVVEADGAQGSSYCFKEPLAGSLSHMNDSKDAGRTDVIYEEIPKCVLSQSVDSSILFFWSSTAKLLVRHTGWTYDGHEKLILSHNDEDVDCEWSQTPVLRAGWLAHEELAEFVVVGKNLSGYVLLLVDWKDGVAYRRGLATVDVYHWANLDNLVWKMISLG